MRRSSGRRPARTRSPRCPPCASAKRRRAMPPPAPWIRSPTSTTRRSRPRRARIRRAPPARPSRRGTPPHSRRRRPRPRSARSTRPGTRPARSRRGGPPRGPWRARRRPGTGCARRDDLRRRALRERDHRRPAGKRLDHDQAERLRPADRYQQRPRALVELALAFRIGLAHVLDPVTAELRLDRLREEPLLAGLDRPGKDQRRAGPARRGDRALRPPVGRHAPHPQQEVVLVLAVRPLGAVDRVVDHAPAAHLRRGRVELGTRDRHDAGLGAVGRRTRAPPRRTLRAACGPPARPRGRPSRARCARRDRGSRRTARRARPPRRSRRTRAPRGRPRCARSSRRGARPAARGRPSRATTSPEPRRASRRGRARRGRRTAGARPPRCRRRREPGPGSTAGRAWRSAKGGRRQGGPLRSHPPSRCRRLAGVPASRRTPCCQGRHASRQIGHWRTP